MIGMLVVKLELWPKGDQTRAVSYGHAFIANVGGDVDHGNYKLTIAKSPSMGARRAGVWRQAAFRGFPRRSKAFGPWDLLAVLLVAALGDRLRRLHPKPSPPQEKSS